MTRLSSGLLLPLQVNVWKHFEISLCLSKRLYIETRDSDDTAPRILQLVIRWG